MNDAINILEMWFKELGYKTVVWSDVNIDIITTSMENPILIAVANVTIDGQKLIVRLPDTLCRYANLDKQYTFNLAEKESLDNIKKLFSDLARR